MAVHLGEYTAQGDARGAMALSCRRWILAASGLTLITDRGYRAAFRYCGIWCLAYYPLTICRRERRLRTRGRSLDSTLP